jgi:hypothetical protein
MSINEFKARFEDIARLNRFRVECIKFPPNALVLAMTMPGESFNTETHRDPDHLGPIPYKFPVDIIQNDASITFINDSLYTARTFLDQWWKEIFDPGVGKGFGYWEEFKADIKMVAMDRQFNDVYSITLVDAYPIMYSDTPYEAAPEAGPAMTTVQFAYGDIIKIAGGTASGAVPNNYPDRSAFEEILRGVLGTI